MAVMEITYEKTAEGHLKRIQSHEVETIYTLEELNSRKEELLEDRTSLVEKHEADLARVDESVAEMDGLLAKAAELGVGEEE